MIALLSLIALLCFADPVNVSAAPRQVSVSKAAMLYLPVGYHERDYLLASGVYSSSGESARFAYVGCGFSLSVNGAGFGDGQQLQITIDGVLEDVIEPNGRIGSGAYGTGCGWHKVDISSGLYASYWLQGVDVWGSEYVEP